jgi:hypothetical protein
MELLQLVDGRVKEAARPLREEVTALKLLLARVSGSSEPDELDSSKQKSYVVEEENLYGCFSPHGPSSLPNESAAPEHEGMDLVATQALDLGKCANVDTIVSVSPESDRQPVAKSGVLTHVPICSSPVVSADFESEDIGEFLAPVLQITPELHELCGWCFRRCCALLGLWRLP